MSNPQPTDPPPSEEQLEALLPSPRRDAIKIARLYWQNARALEVGELQHAHAELAQTAALVSIAESLNRLCDLANARAPQRQQAMIASALQTMAKEVSKMRYIMKG